MKKIYSFKNISSIRKAHPKKKICLSFGTFDQIDFSTFNHLQTARKQCDLLVLLVAETTTSQHYQKLSPQQIEKKAQMLSELGFVDAVVIYPFEDAVKAIQALKPQILVRHSSYRSPQSDFRGYLKAEEEALREFHGKIVYTEDPFQESSNNNILNWHSTQIQAIKRGKQELRHYSLESFFEKMAKTRVLIVGEPIVDTYVFCETEGISSKSPSISARYRSEENYPGGSLAIARHLSALGCQVTLFIPYGGESYFKQLLHNTVSPSINIETYLVPNTATPRKTRYLVSLKSQRIFELTQLEDNLWKHHSPEGFIKKMESLNEQHDLVLLSDFGHGLFEGPVLKAANKMRNFKGINVQTNSSNFGFNPFTKHHKYNYLSLDERECRMASHDRLTPICDLAEQTVQKLVKTSCAVTLGQAGSAYFDSQKTKYFCPGFFKEVIDTVGAGDAYFALTTLLHYHKARPFLIPYLGNCFAGLKTRILGNKEAVSQESLSKFISYLSRSVS
ncbi:MAG: hypothetical protein IPJ69_03210 [Deltaproteobacteria bacterium]|nr:MAG: hypothetical protein IPJ69_03210 [Deltaproteobacteria bacterium]